ncbi:hypothetical protein PLICRDRAFT_40737 [Plicaturopsis crispa FD-325 SS-3]|nr:hypothetical protein PLICRDRAFT_40737 [Plicaturopsis crispa FD-325 SS-3]
MAKTTTQVQKATARSGRPAARGTAQKARANETTQDDDLEDIGGLSVEEEEEDNGLMDIEILKMIKKSKAKRATTASTTFAKKQAALFKAANNRAELIVREGNSYFEQAKASAADWRKQEESHDKHMRDLLPMWEASDDAVNTVLELYPALFNDLIPRKVEQIENASRMLELFPEDRARSRKTVMRNFKARADQNLENAKLATDATELIAHYKGLLRSS